MLGVAPRFAHAWRFARANEEWTDEMAYSDVPSDYV